MNDPILSRESIAHDADLAAAFFCLGGVKPKNPHEEGTDAHRAWAAAFERYLLLHSAPDAEASA